MSPTLSSDFASKQFLLGCLHNRYVTKKMSSIVPFSQGLSLTQVSTSYHMQKLRLQGGGGVQAPLSTKQVCQKSSTSAKG